MTQTAYRVTQERTVRPSPRRLLVLFAAGAATATAAALRQADDGWVEYLVAAACGLAVMAVIGVLRWKVERLVVREDILERVNMLGRPTRFPLRDLTRATIVTVRYLGRPATWVLLERTASAVPVRFDGNVWNPAELRDLLEPHGVEVRKLDEPVSAKEFQSMFPGFRPPVWERRPILFALVLTAVIVAVVIAAFGLASLFS
ncbi:hypothetical protein CC117_19735 [Parafrankia colletiae]|uniref:PH domain-containing protein n=1 Tax=Parafrankia colletiae TaxID=573497 RepID=A0A1S1QL30_9ACTN|nr:hypothetical protein [Parafrankia colletiae]MCK9903429.1 hypothetical protein [Frankia sp. Cpl3]OHV35463.1 hypothetical protein CC117_19735 [Parafrankia colletiae]